MSYEIIEKTQYGVLVKKMKSIPTECEKCKYTGRAVTLDPCKSCKTDNSYYLSDLEAEKLETVITVNDFFKVKSTKNKALLKEFEKMINNPDNSLADAYAKKTESEMQVFYDSQKELLDLQIENKKLKERIGSINEYLDNRISECDYVEKEMDSDNLDTQGIIHIKNSYQNVKEFINNQK